jgi:hypothetical protein
MWRFQVMNETERRKSEWLSEHSEFHSLPFRSVIHRPEISRATFFGTFLLWEKKGAPSERLKKYTSFIMGRCPIPWFIFYIMWSGLNILHSSP